METAEVSMPLWHGRKEAMPDACCLRRAIQPGIAIATIVVAAVSADELKRFPPLSVIPGHDDMER